MHRAFFLGYIVLSLLGALLLMLPISRNGDLDFIDAFFTSVSAISLTGLIVKDTSSFWTDFGRGVILVLIQIGGIGYMSAILFVFLLSGSKESFYIRKLFSGSLGISMSRIYSFIRNILIVFLVFEALGIFMLSFSMDIYDALFHAISSFCNAGFSTFENSLIHVDSYTKMVVSMLVVFGGLGIFVYENLASVLLGKSKLNLHTKVVLISTFMLVSFGTLFFMLYEDLPFMDALFSAITPRTAGFSVLDYGELSDAGIFLTILFMVVGGGSGGTAGGIKLTTAFVVWQSFLAMVKGHDEFNALGYRVSKDTINKAFIVFLSYTFFAISSTFLLLVLENVGLKEALFESISALSNVGLSMKDGLSLSSDFSTFGKIVIIANMLIGKAGLLTVVYMLLERSTLKVKYSKGKIYIG